MPSFASQRMIWDLIGCQNMIPGAPDPKDVGRAYAMAQVGMEMVVPIGIGVGLDYWLGWTPWATVVGAILGFVGGLYHLISMLNKDDRSSKPRAGSPQ